MQNGESFGADKAGLLPPKIDKIDQRLIDSQRTQLSTLLGTLLNNGDQSKLIPFLDDLQLAFAAEDPTNALDSIEERYLSI